MNTNIEIGCDALGAYLTADSGDYLAVWGDGHWAIVDGSLSFRETPDAPVALIRCPGIGNLDSSYFTEGFVERLDDGLYHDLDTGALVGDLADVISACCSDGDVSGLMKELQEKLEREIEEAEEERRMFGDGE